MRIESNIYRLKSGRFQVRITTADGIPIKESFDALDQARTFRDRVDLDRRLRKHGLPGIIQRRPRLLEMIRDWLGEHEDRVRSGSLADRTFTTYFDLCVAPRQWIERALRRPAIFADEVDDRLVGRYVAWREGSFRSKKARRPASDVQVRRELALLSRIYKWGGVERRWTIPRRLRKTKGGKRVLPSDQLWSFLEAMPLGSLERTVAELAIATGMRPGDIHRLDEDDVDLEHRTIRFQASKTGKRQVLPFGEGLERHLRAWMSSRIRAVHGRVFHLEGRTLTHDTLRRRFRTASKEAGIDPPIEYIGGARNAFIAYLLEVGENPYDIAEYVGHEGLELLMRYKERYIPLDALRRVSDAMERLRGG